MRDLCVLLLTAASLNATTFYVTVAGLGGEPQYAQRFSAWAAEADKLFRAAPDARATTLSGPDSTRAHIEAALSQIAAQAHPSDNLVLLLIGHGTFDDVDYKINLPGPDMTGAQLAALLDKIPTRRQLIVNTTSASGASAAALRKSNRIVITATKNGAERNATVFARYWIEAVRDPASDTDKNGVISALEAFRYAERKTLDFYESQKRLSTEHPLFADAPGGEAFPVLRLNAASSANDTPEKRRLNGHREELERQIDRLKYEKAALPGDEYKKQLTALLLDLARTQAELDK